MSDELEIYNKLIRGYATIVRCALGTSPMSNLTKAHWALVHGKQTRSSAGLDIEISGSVLWRLVVMALGNVHLGKPFQVEAYLAYLFACERFLRSVGTPQATAMANYVGNLLTWNGKVWHRSVDRDFGGLQFVLAINQFFGNKPWSLAFSTKDSVPTKTSLTLSPKLYMPLASFFHPVAFEPALLALKSEEDHADAFRPWNLWKGVGYQKGSGWYPITIGYNHPLDGVLPMVWDFSNTLFEGAVFDGVQFKDRLLGSSYFLMYKSKFSGCHFAGAKLSNVQSASAMFDSCSFDGCDFYSAKMSSSLLNACSFSETEFAMSDLSNSKLSDCEFSKCKFIQTYLRDTEISSSFASCLFEYFTDVEFHDIKKSGDTSLIKTYASKTRHASIAGSSFRKCLLGNDGSTGTMKMNADVVFAMFDPYYDADDENYAKNRMRLDNIKVSTR